MSRRGRFILWCSLISADALGIALALAVAFLTTATRPTMPWRLLALGEGVFLACFMTLRLYDLEIILEDSQEYATVATASTYGSLLFSALLALSGVRGLDLAALVIGWLSCIFGVSLGRFLLRRVVRAMRRRGHLIATVLIAGADEQGRAIAHQLKSESDSGWRVIGFVDDFLPPGTLVQDDLRVLGHPSKFPALAAEYGVAEIVVVPGAMAWESFHQILEFLVSGSGPRIRLSPGYYDLLAATPRVAHRNFVPLITVDPVRLSGFDALFKTILDHGLGKLIFILALPLLLVLTLTRGFRGSVFDRHIFLTLGGRTFPAYTFRTAPQSWLRRSGLYCLPLLWAVVTGDLSLVGPRPIPVAQRENYRRWLTLLISVKPGLTGPWAVVPVASLEEEMRAAVYYIRNWTIWLDLQILAQTVLVILRSRWGTLGQS